MINPFTVKKLLDNKNEFAANHTEFFSYIRNTFGGPLEEGTRMAIFVQRPGQEATDTSLEISKADLKFLKALQDLL